MPYSIGQSKQCPPTKPHAVVGPDGKVAPGGCHPNRESAVAHQRALMVNVKDSASVSEPELAEIAAGAALSEGRRVQGEARKRRARHTRARRSDPVAPEEKAEYRNCTDSNIGAVKLDRVGEEHGVAVRPGETVWLTEEERRATARAPREASDNPFANGSFVKVSDSRMTDTDDRPIDVPPPAPEQAEEPQSDPEPPPAPEQPQAASQTASQTAPTQGGDLRKPVKPQPVATAEETAARHAHEETGIAEPPRGKPIEGEYAEREEVGTPQAPVQGTEAIKTPGPKRAARPKAADPKPGTPVEG